MVKYNNGPITGQTLKPNSPLTATNIILQKHLVPLMHFKTPLNIHTIILGKNIFNGPGLGFVNGSLNGEVEKYNISKDKISPHTDRYAYLQDQFSEKTCTYNVGNKITFLNIISQLLVGAGVIINNW